MFSERINGFGLRNALALVALLATAALVFTHSAGADDPTFAPTVTLQTSTTRAAAHPDARVTIDNSQSSEAIRDITMDLPSGMMGSLNAADQCSAEDAEDEDCPASSQVGTVTNYATVDQSDAVLRGKVYLTEALSPYDDEDPAGLQIVVPAVIGGVNMGKVVVNARVQMNYAPVSPDWGEFTPTGAVGVIRGVRTIVNDVPRDITDEHGRHVEFSLKKLVVDLPSNQEAPYSKLLTNASRCRTSQIAIAAESYENTSASDTQDYTTTQCEDVHVDDAEMSFTSSNTTAGSAFNFSTTTTFPDDQPSVSDLTMRLPPNVGVYAPGFGNPYDQCPVTNVNWGENGDENNFSPVGCPPQAKIGTAEIETPLLDHPIIGEVWLIESTVPNLGIYVDPTTGPNNPAGVQFGIGGSSVLDKVDQSCSSSDAGCLKEITINFSGLPDVPIKKITVSNDGVSRQTGHDSSGDPVEPGDPNEVTLVGQFIRNASNTDATCQPVNDVTASYHSWVDEAQERGASAITEFPVSGCNTRVVTLTDAPFGGFAVANPPTLSYADATVATIKCSITNWSYTSMSFCNPVGGVGGGYSLTPGSALSPGIHYFFERTTSPVQSNLRAFAIPADPPTDTDAPAVTLGTVPSNPTSDTTPSINFTSDENAYFQCSLDGAAFLPCDGSVTDPATSGSYTVPSALIPNDNTHTIDVRAQDAAGNMSDTESTSFKVEVALDPTFEVLKPDTNDPGISTVVARAHPEFDIKVTSGSHEDIQNLELEMPQGLLGGLTAVPTVCDLNTAKAGNCTDASKVGTVDTEAVVDESTVRISGKVFLTTPIALGDPAGLVIDVPAKIQDIDDGHVIVPVRLAVRGPKVGNAFTNIEGVNSIATDLPQSIDPEAWGNTYDTESEFDLRSMTVKLRNNPSAPQPLLTNPSDCTPDGFGVSFDGYDGTEVSKTTDDIVWTGCSGLAFSPSVSMSLIDINTGKAPVERTAGYIPVNTFTTDLALDPNGSSIKSASVLLPKNVTVNVGELPAPCPVDTYQNGGADACPASTIMGTVSATTPLLPSPLEGKVYILKSNTSLPRLILALRGPINTDILGDMVFEDVASGDSNIRTTFSSSPDAPISSLHLVVNRIVSTTDDACKFTDLNAVSSFTAYNGKASTSVNAIPVACNGSATASFSYKKATKKQKNRSTLKIAARAPTGTTFKSIEVRFPKGISMIKKGFKKGLSIKYGSKKLKYSCGKASKTNKFVSALCKKSNQFIYVNFNAGTLKAKKVKRAKFTIIAIDNLGRTHVMPARSRK